MPDATFFSIDVAVAKARNVAYYADPNQLQAIDQVPGLPKGVAMTNRTFRYLAEPRFPEGIDINPPGPFSILNETGVRTVGAPKPASAFQSVQGFDSFNPQSNFHDPFNVANQNGIVFFPGSAPLYKDVNGSGSPQLVGGLGVSGDGVDQDDDVTFQAAVGFEVPSNVLRADQVYVRGARLPYQKFNRQPHEPFGQGSSEREPARRYQARPARGAPTESQRQKHPADRQFPEPRDQHLQRGQHRRSRAGGPPVSQSRVMIRGAMVRSLSKGGPSDARPQGRDVLGRPRTSPRFRAAQRGGEAGPRAGSPRSRPRTSSPDRHIRTFKETRR